MTDQWQSGWCWEPLFETVLIFMLCIQYLFRLVLVVVQKQHVASLKKCTEIFRNRNIFSVLAKTVLEDRNY